MMCEKDFLKKYLFLVEGERHELMREAIRIRDIILSQAQDSPAGSLTNKELHDITTAIFERVDKFRLTRAAKGLRWPMIDSQSEEEVEYQKFENVFFGVYLTACVEIIMRGPHEDEGGDMDPLLKNPDYRREAA